jgi:hypothetical protein
MECKISKRHPLKIFASFGVGYQFGVAAMAIPKMRGIAATKPLDGLATATWRGDFVRLF